MTQPVPDPQRTVLPLFGTLAARLQWAWTHASLGPRTILEMLCAPREVARTLIPAFPSLAPSKRAQSETDSLIESTCSTSQDIALVTDATLRFQGPGAEVNLPIDLSANKIAEKSDKHLFNREFTCAWCDKKTWQPKLRSCHTRSWCSECTHLLEHDPRYECLRAGSGSDHDYAGCLAWCTNEEGKNMVWLVKNKRDGLFSCHEGEKEEGETALATAILEFTEETGMSLGTAKCVFEDYFCGSKFTPMVMSHYWTIKLKKTDSERSKLAQRFQKDEISSTQFVLAEHIFKCMDHHHHRTQGRRRGRRVTRKKKRKRPVRGLCQTKPGPQADSGDKVRLGERVRDLVAWMMKSLGLQPLAQGACLATVGCPKTKQHDGSQHPKQREWKPIPIGKDMFLRPSHSKLYNNAEFRRICHHDLEALPSKLTHFTSIENLLLIVLTQKLNGTHYRWETWQPGIWCMCRSKEENARAIYDTAYGVTGVFRERKERQGRANACVEFDPTDARSNGFTVKLGGDVDRNIWAMTYNDSPDADLKQLGSSVCCSILDRDKEGNLKTGGITTITQKDLGLLVPLSEIDCVGKSIRLLLRIPSVSRSIVQWIKWKQKFRQCLGQLCSGSNGSKKEGLAAQRSRLP